MNGLQSADQENCNEDEGLVIEVDFLLPAERVAEPAPPTRSTKLKVLDISHVETTDHPVLLHPLSERETVHLARRWQENIQSAIENHLPAGIRRDVACIE